MTFIQQFTPPAVITSPTWLRANLGWASSGVEPNRTACQASWTWGNVVDQQVHLSARVIEEITVRGSVSPFNPETTRDVTLEARIRPAGGYEIVRVAWSGDLIPGEGNPYIYRPDAGTHGSKRVKATVTYRHIATESTGQTAKDRDFKLFFVKDGDENGDSIPNWFEHWKADGAVSQLDDAIVQYDATLGGQHLRLLRSQYR